MGVQPFTGINFIFLVTVCRQGRRSKGFWFFKNVVTLNPDGSFNGIHCYRRYFNISNFVNGGGIPVITAYEWVGSGGSDGTLNLLTVWAMIFTLL